MLHGYLSCKESFSYQTDFFSRYFTVVVPDMAGFNGVPMAYPYALDDYACDLKNLLRPVVGRINVIAHSFGARVLFKFLPDERVDKIVLTGAAGIRPRRSLKRAVKVFRYKFRKRLGLDVSDFGSSDFKALDTLMKKSFVKIVNERLENRIRAVDKKTLIVVGDADKETPPYMAKRMNKLIDGSALGTISAPDRVNTIVKEFLL